MLADAAAAIAILVEDAAILWRRLTTSSATWTVAVVVAVDLERYPYEFCYVSRSVVQG